MGRVLSNETSLAYAIEQTQGELPASPTWHGMEPNNINNFGAQINTVVRSPISKNRQRKKGAITDLDSAVEVDSDLTMDQLRDFTAGFLFARLAGPMNLEAAEDGLAAVAAGYSYDALADSSLPAGMLVYARGFSIASNNGLKVVDSGSTTSLIDVVGGANAETPSATRRASIGVAGFRGASGDLSIDGDGNLTSSSTDFETLKLLVGQAIHIGGELTANQFGNAANSGFCRVTSISTNKLTLDKRSQDFSADNGAGKSVDILFGQFCRNVTTEEADYIQRSFQFEASFPGLADDEVGTEFEYSIGNFCDTMSFSLPIADKATTTIGFVGTDSDPITDSRKTNADQGVEPEQTAAFNTTSDVARLRVTELDETGLSTDFKSMTLNITNNVTPEKVIGNLGARYMNAGNFEVNIETQLLFVSRGIPNAIRNNTTLSMDFSLQNSDGGVFVDIPAVTVGGGQKEYPTGESVILNTTLAAFQDNTYGYTIGFSFFPYLPGQ